MGRILYQFETELTVELNSILKINLTELGFNLKYDSREKVEKIILNLIDEAIRIYALPATPLIYKIKTIEENVISSPVVKKFGR